MGVCGTKDSKSVLDPVCPTDPDHMSIEKQFGPLIDPKHPNNLNHKYSHLYKVDLNMVIGEGIKRTCGYVSRVPIEEIRKKRLEFWDTRIEGIKQTWKALQYACESNDTPTIVTTLKAADIKLINRTLQMSYDGQNYRYDVPIFMINDPTSFETTKVEEVVVTKELNIKLRSQKDYIVKVSNTEPCSVLIAELAKHENIQGKRTQLFFAGKMMQDIQPIGNFMNEDGVVSVFLRNQPPA